MRGGVRETREEARARVEVGDLYTLFNLPHINQVYLVFRRRLLDLDYGPGAESLDVRLFRESEIPWDEIAFPVIKETLSFYFRDRASGGFEVRTGDIVRLDGDIRRYRVSIHPRT